MTENQMKSLADESARRGALLLDGKEARWPGRIDKASLDLTHCAHCVLGQLYGGYVTGQTVLGHCGWEFGFSWPAFPDRTDGVWYTALLNEAWKREIDARLSRMDDEAADEPAVIDVREEVVS